ncbi:MarR family winged helix-turn-helix transcriptional regulator [Pseudomonas aeruginosa]
MVESNKTAADTYSLAIFRAIRRLQQAAEIHSKRLSRYGGLTPLQLLILHVLAVEGELTATQLAKLVSLSQASLSGVLDRLEGRGLLYRRRDEQDRRKSWLHLDPAGHEALAEAPPLSGAEAGLADAQHLAVAQRGEALGQAVGGEEHMARLVEPGMPGKIYVAEGAG